MGVSSLSAAVDKAVNALGEEKYLLLSGDEKTERKAKGSRGSLLDISSPAARNTSSVISERVLGPKTDVDWKTIDLLPDMRASADRELSNIISERFAAMRSRMEWLDTPSGEIPSRSGDSDTALGFTEDGEPIWREVVGEHRKRLMAMEPTSVAHNIQTIQPQEIIGPDWPSQIPSHSPYDFAGFHVCPENLRAARAVDTILDEPCSRWNPLLLEGGNGTGKSHLLWACGQQMKLQDPLRQVRILNSSQCSDKRPEGWERTLTSTSMLLIDDLHEISDANHQNLGEIIDWAINAGCQVVITSNGFEHRKLPPSRLKHVLVDSRWVSLRRPRKASRMTYLRERSATRRLLIDDSALAVVEECSSGDWRSLSQSIEVLAESIERGAAFDSTEDIRNIFSTIPNDPEELHNDAQLDSASLATELIEGAIQSAIHQPLEPDITLASSMQEIVDDDYQVPDLMPANSETAVKNLLDRHLGQELERMSEPVGDAIGVHERERHFIDERRTPSSDEMIKVKSDLSTLDLQIDEKFDLAYHKVADEKSQLITLLDELQNLSESMINAGARDLIRMVDRLYDIEMQLHQLDPKRWPVPSMPENKRRVKRKEPEVEEVVVEETFNSSQAGNRSVATIRALRILQPTTERISEEE